MGELRKYYRGLIIHEIKKGDGGNR